MQNYIVFTTNPNLKQYKSCLKRYNYKKYSYLCPRYVHVE